MKNPVGKEQLNMGEKRCTDGEREVLDEAEGHGVWTAGEPFVRPGRKKETGGKEGWVQTHEAVWFWEQGDGSPPCREFSLSPRNGKQDQAQEPGN